MRRSGGMASVYNNEGSFAWRTLFIPLFMFSSARMYACTAFERCPERSFTVDSWNPSLNSLEHIVALPECPVICLPVVYVNFTLKGCAVGGTFSYNSVDSFTITNPAASHCKRKLGGV